MKSQYKIISRSDRIFSLCQVGFTGNCNEMDHLANQPLVKVLPTDFDTAPKPVSKPDPKPIQPPQAAAQTPTNVQPQAQLPPSVPSLPPQNTQPQPTQNQSQSTQNQQPNQPQVQNQAAAQPVTNAYQNYPAQQEPAPSPAANNFQQQYPQQYNNTVDQSQMQATQTQPQQIQQLTQPAVNNAYQNYPAQTNYQQYPAGYSAASQYSTQPSPTAQFGVSPDSFINQYPTQASYQSNYSPYYPPNQYSSFQQPAYQAVPAAYDQSRISPMNPMNPYPSTYPSNVIQYSQVVTTQVHNPPVPAPVVYQPSPVLPARNEYIQYHGIHSASTVSQYQQQRPNHPPPSSWVFLEISFALCLYLTINKAQYIWPSYRGRTVHLRRMVQVCGSRQ